jgi:hypothetical protein
LNSDLLAAELVLALMHFARGIAVNEPPLFGQFPEMTFCTLQLREPCFIVPIVQKVPSLTMVKAGFASDLPYAQTSLFSKIIVSLSLE